MKIRTRSRIILTATLIIFLVFLSFITQSIILQSFSAIEKKETQSHVERFVAQLDNEVETVASTCRDWALRDETAAVFTETGTVDDPSQVFQPISMKNLDISYIVLYNASGSRVFSETVTNEGETIPGVPPELDTIVRDSIIPEGLQTGIAGRRGISSLNGDPVILSGYTVSYGTISDPREGTMVMARVLDDSRIGTIDQMLQVDGSLIPLQAGEETGVLSATEIQAAQGGEIIVHPSGDNELNGFAIITGIENTPSFLLLKITTTRQIYQQVKTSIVIVAGSIIFLSIIFLVVVQLLTQRFILAPLSELDSGMKSIGGSGDLNLRMEERGDEEIVSLTRSLNRMLGQIQQQQIDMQALLEEIQQQRDDLAEARQDLADRNRALEELNRKANLYLDIYLDAITYEILNAIMGLRGYAELVRASGGGKEQLFAEKIIALAKKSDDVIRNIETISRIYKNPPELRDTDLAAIISREAESHPGARIRMEHGNRKVSANDMLGVVFDNLFSNSLKFGGSDTEITVSARDDTLDMLEIAVSDTGPGIPDAVKPNIFDRFASGDPTKRSSFGLGLHIVKMLVEGYGGKVWAEDRIPGNQGSGASIHFTLRKA
jgi:signal transduction histidine kinase